MTTTFSDVSLRIQSLFELMQNGTAQQHSSLLVSHLNEIVSFAKKHREKAHSLHEFLYYLEETLIYFPGESESWSFLQALENFEQIPSKYFLEILCQAAKSEHCFATHLKALLNSSKDLSSASPRDFPETMISPPAAQNP